MSLYLYGIAFASNAKDGLIEKDDLYVYVSGELAALVRELDEGEEPHTGTATLIEHATAMNTWLSPSQAIPAAFGTVLPDERALEDFLDSNAHNIQKQLKRFENRVEIGLKAIWREEVIQEQLRAEEASASQSDRGLENGSPQHQEQEKRFKEALRQRNHLAAEHLLDNLIRHTDDHRLKDPLLDHMALNAAFLIEKNQLSDFDEELEALDQHFEDQIVFQYTGPTVPYHFADIST